jgi:predicted metal-dependent phosphoesterase TrpH
MKLDLHIHSVFSRDGAATVEEIVERCKAQGLQGFAITDHNAVEGALRSLELASSEGLVAVPGVEVSTAEGHVLAYGVREIIPRDLSVAETIDRIRAAGGVAVAAHPKRLPSGIGLKLASKERFDAIETLNGGSSSWGNRQAVKVAEARKIPQTGGSDAHRAHEVGRAYTVMEDVSTAEEVLDGVRKGKSSPDGRNRDAREEIVYAWETFTGWLDRGMNRL